ncbi:hypothetical protein DUI87_20377 [Hirundo rustica rustica]|uniref:Uncharacterized protein n=1 Tax=Hirundo rustica rustica TaxID=333673 RepID=A0A3M0JQB9_HIRRU|nr:hypothetical protein DUI87_20377 [Hirundo rustica rustica]
MEVDSSFLIDACKESLGAFTQVRSKRRKATAVMWDRCKRSFTKREVKSSMAFRAQGRHFNVPEHHSLSKSISVSVDGKCQGLKHVSKQYSLTAESQRV